jgi:hypothetical protein
VGIVDQISQLSKARLGCQLVGVAGAAKEPEEAVELGDCSATGVFDRAQRLSCTFWITIHDPSRSSCLYTHHAHMVRHDIVQLAGDPHPFCEHCLTRVLLAFSLKLNSLSSESSLTVPQGPNRSTKHPRQGEDDHVVQQVKASNQGRCARCSWEEQLAYEFSSDGEVAQDKERSPKLPIAIHGDAVEHQPQREQRDVGLGHVDNGPGSQESGNDDQAD